MKAMGGELAVSGSLSQNALGVPEYQVWGPFSICD